MSVRSPFDRVVFVCIGERGEYSPGVYLHGPDGGDPACLSLATAAAHTMRAGEPRDSAAGLCGYIFKSFGDSVASGGGLSLLDSPKPGPDGSVDWLAYCPWNVDLILINVDHGTASCFVSAGDPKSGKKPQVAEITGLKFGG